MVELEGLTAKAAGGRWMTKEHFARKLVRLFPEYQRAYQDHLKAYGAVLGHVLFAELNPVLAELLRANQDKTLIRKYIGFIEDMYCNGDTDVKDIVTCTILEYLGDEEAVLRTAFSYFSEELMLASKAVEAGWGRREIRIYRKNGKARYEWEPPSCGRL